MANKKKAAKSTKPAAATTNADVTVRMFCQGLGDCFLITLPQAGDRDYSIMIDCGVAMGTPKTDKIMPDVVQKIAELTAGTVDLLVITHEHWDHVSGFIQAANEMTKDKLEFKHLWCAWTEDPQDDLAKKLKADHSKAKLALARARQMAAQLAVDPASAEHLAALDGVLAFYGPGAALGVGKGGGTLADAMDATRTLAGADADERQIDYLMPGQNISLPEATGFAAKVRAYALGPPHDEDKVTRINPRKKDSETYEKEKHALSAFGVNWAWMSRAMKDDVGVAALAGDPTDSACFDSSRPFDSKWQIDLKGAEEDPFFAQRYFADTDENAGGRIDGDWLWSGAQNLALHIESYTNNTSLVLAFELPKSKKVLLFSGDAQVGNWLSWHDQDYTADDGQKVKATNLLERTVLYKVGHHGSHNATLRAQGLELMKHHELVALLPVEAAAVKRLRYGEMPLQSLVKALTERTQGRILRVDEDWTNGKPPGTWGPNLNEAKLSVERITVGKEGETAERPLYMECTIMDR